MEVRGSINTPKSPVSLEINNLLPETKSSELSKPTATVHSLNKSQVLRDVRDWLVALVVLAWGGTGIYDRFFPANPASLQKNSTDDFIKLDQKEKGKIKEIENK
ncbi:MAG: hypothetical protein HY094_04980 [Candidatus Melainabacteria bacterium]|nr:hypothetical protein [Candidatus Melainabacteria bacterium]